MIRHLIPASSSSWRRPGGVSSTNDSGGRSAVSRGPLPPGLRQVQHHDVVVRVDRGADFIERFAQVRDRGKGRRQQRLRAVDEQQRPVRRPPALVHHLLRGIDVDAKAIVAPIRRKADEIQVGRGGPLVGDIRERMVQQHALRGEYGFRSRRHAFGYRRGRAGRLPPRIIGREARRQPDGCRE